MRGDGYGCVGWVGLAGDFVGEFEGGDGLVSACIDGTVEVPHLENIHGWLEIQRGHAFHAVVENEVHADYCENFHQWCEIKRQRVGRGWIWRL
jgi:hypothetical protein